MIYPMKSELRRKERNEKIINELKTNYEHFIDMSDLEKQNEFLESTGSLIFDNLNRRVYCSISERANESALKIFIENLNMFSKEKYELISFKSSDKDSYQIYHTNVMMSILEKHVVVCSDVVKNPEEKKLILEKLALNREIIDISYEELLNFGCNILMVKNSDNENVLILSKSAYDNYSTKVKEILENNYKLCINQIDTIEFIGGGSARCMVGELY
jgi:hypothetical protein